MKKLFLFVVVFLAIVVATFLFAPQLVYQFLPGNAQQQVGMVLNKVNGDASTLAVQGQQLREAFLRKHSLGFAIEDITLDDKDPTGILAEPVLLDLPQLAAHQFADTPATGFAWQLGGATGLASNDTYYPDYYGYVTGIAASACATTGDIADNAAIDPAAFADKTAVLKFTSPTSNNTLLKRASGCVASTDGNFIYYQLLYGRGLKTQRLQ